MKNIKKDNKNEVVIELQGITKQYFLRHQKPTLTDFFFRPSNYKQKFTALNDFNLKVYKGEKLGVFGRNGAGKTTLLKIISGITTPNSGSVYTKGKVVSLIDLSAGFHMDLSGEENIFLNGTVIGMRHTEIEENFNKIVSFADIGDFINQPMYTYSEGMVLRLAFSIAIHSNPDILVMDEGFAVGDQNFRDKCDERIKVCANNGISILIVSHFMDYLRSVTDRIIEM